MAEEPAFPRKIAAAFYFFLILLGILFYFGWGVRYGTWDVTRRENVGVYALTVILIGFGVTGFVLYRKPLKRAEGESE